MSVKRKLTSNEIENILSNIVPQSCIPIEVANASCEYNKNKLRKQLLDQLLYPEIIPVLKANITKTYFETLIQPGENVGVLTAQSIGEKQTQLSVSYNEKILIKKNNKIVNTTIGEFIDKEMKYGKSYIIDDHSSFKPLNKGIEIMTVSQDEKIEWKNITEISKHHPKGNLVTVTTQSGRHVTTTLSHSHLKKHNDSIIPVLGSKLKIGDRIPVVKRAPIPFTGLTNICVSDYIDGKVENNVITVKRTQLKNIININDIFGWFIGAYLSEGSCTDYTVSITNVNVQFKDQLTKFTDSLGLTIKTVQNQGTILNGTKIYKSTSHIINSRILSSLITELCGNGSFNKKIPEFVFGCSKVFIASVIRGWIDGDGNISENKKEIRGFSVCKNLLEQFSVLFTYFGIYGTIGLQNKKHNVYEYHIYGKEYSSIYLNEIGTILTYKQKSLENILLTVDTAGSRLEMIPFDIGRHITKLSSKLKMNGHSRYERLGEAISRNGLGKIINKFQEKAYEIKENIDNDESFVYIKKSYNADIVWDKIIDIKIINEEDYEHKFVYDFSVTGNETFALQSGIVVHNTLNSVDWYSDILYTKNNKSIVEPVGQMIDRLLDQNPNDIVIYQKNNTEYLALPDGYFIPSGDFDGFNKWHKIEAVTRHLPNGKLVKIKTQSGREVSASQSKSFLVWNGIQFIDTLGSKIKVGDILPTTKNMPRPYKIQEYFDISTIFQKDKYLYTTEVVNAREYREKEFSWFKDHIGKDFIVPYKRGDTMFGRRKDELLAMKAGFVHIHPSANFVSNIPDKIPLDNDFGFLIGIYLAEGCSTKTFVCISNNDEKIRQRITDWCDRYGITYHLVIKMAENLNVQNGIGHYLKLHSVLLTRILVLLCNTGSSNKFVPHCAYTAPTEFIKGLIDGYYSGDGTVSLKYGSVIVSSASKQLITGISFLLSYFEIFGKMSGCQLKCNNVGSKNIKYSYTLSIRNGFAQTFAKEIPITEQKKQGKLQIITLQTEYKYDCGRNQEEYPQERDVYFDPIVSMEFVEATNGVVYDFTIEKTRNFNLFNGLVVRDSFHTAGKGNTEMTQAAPRFSELLMATKSQKKVICYVYFKEKNESIDSLREMIGNSIVELTFNKISKSYKIHIEKKEEKWYEAFKIIYNDDFSKYTDCISINVNMDVLYEYKLTMKQIADCITEEYSDMTCVFSPDEIGQLDIFIDTFNIDLPENREAYIDSEHTKEIYIEEVVQPLLEKIVICGISGIEEMYFNNDNDKWMIETDGTNYPKLLAHPDVDMTRTISNNVWDIYNVLGVEAARQFLIDEFCSVLDGINECHTKLLVERMTYTGSVASISRYTMRGSDSGPLGKSSFEETLDNFMRAGIFGQEDPITGVSASIICGKLAKIGTGICDLRMDIRKLPKHIDDHNDYDDDDEKKIDDLVHDVDDLSLQDIKFVEEEEIDHDHDEDPEEEQEQEDDPEDTW